MHPLTQKIEPGSASNKWLQNAFNLSILSKSRLAWVDYLRGIAIILVVYRHALIGINRNGITMPEYLLTANMIFFSFRIPLFFIVSGIFISSSLAKKSLHQVLKLKFETLFYVYLVWAAIQVTLQILLSSVTNADRHVSDYLYILYQPRSLDQFWYLPALFNATLVYVLIKIKLKASHSQQLILGLIFYFTSPLLRPVSMLSDWMEFYFFFALGDAISSYFFRANTQRMLSKPSLLVLLIPVFALTQYFYIQQSENFYRDTVLGQAEFMLIALIGCICMFVIAFRLEALNKLRLLRVIGFHSLFIYAMHVLAAALIRTILSKLLGIHEPIILLAGGISGGIIIPIVFYNLLVKDNIGWFLFSFHQNKK